MPASLPRHLPKPNVLFLTATAEDKAACLFCTLHTISSNQQLHAYISEISFARLKVANSTRPNCKLEHLQDGDANLPDLVGQSLAGDGICSHPPKRTGSDEGSCPRRGFRTSVLAER